MKEQALRFASGLPQISKARLRFWTPETVRFRLRDSHEEPFLKVSISSQAYALVEGINLNPFAITAHPQPDD